MATGLRRCETVISIRHQLRRRREVPIEEEHVGVVASAEPL